MPGDDVKVNNTSYEKLEKAVGLHQSVLDDLVSINSLFTIAIFVGLSFASFGGTQHCPGGVQVARRLVKNEVMSFACYLLSSLVAKALKTHLFTYLLNTPKPDDIKSKSSKALRWSMFALSTASSIVGEVLIMFSMIDMIQLRFDKLDCRVTERLNPVDALIAINTLALVIYVPFTAHVIFKSTKIFDNIAKT